MKTKTAGLIALLTLPLVAGTAVAQTVYQATLTGGAEVPPIASPGQGTATLVLDAAQDQISVSVTWSGLLANTTAGHIHGPAAVGVNGPVMFNLNISGSTAGSVSGLTFAITSTQVTNLESGLLYANLHTSSFPGGEIRGQFLPVATAEVGLAASISWYARSNFNYQVEGADAVNTNVWFTLGNPVAGNNTTNYYFDPFGTNSRRFYRIVTRP